MSRETRKNTVKNAKAGAYLYIKTVGVNLTLQLSSDSKDVGCVLVATLCSLGRPPLASNRLSFQATSSFQFRSLSATHLAAPSNSFQLGTVLPKTKYALVVHSTPSLQPLRHSCFQGTRLKVDLRISRCSYPTRRAHDLCSSEANQMKSCCLRLD